METETEKVKNDHQQHEKRERKLDFSHPDIHNKNNNTNKRHNELLSDQRCLSPTKQISSSMQTNPIMLMNNPLLHIQQQQQQQHRQRIGGAGGSVGGSGDRSLAQQALLNRALRNRRHTLANVNRCLFILNNSITL
nr:uncharacterized protein LOC124490905 [Dermatophagoides farinae]